MRLYSKAITISTNCPAANGRTKAAPWETPGNKRKHGRPSISNPWRILLPAALLFVAGALRAEDVTMTLRSAGAGSCMIDGRFRTAENPSMIWKVLSDYDHLPNFVPYMLASRVEERFPDHLLLQQVAIGRALLLFHRQLHVLLKVQEQPGRKITFEDVDHRDFLAYNGLWQIESAEGGGYWVDYHLLATPRFFAPGYVMRASFRTMAKSLLTAIRSEIARRGQLQEPVLCCSEVQH